MNRLFLVLLTGFMLNPLHALANCKKDLNDINNKYKDIYLSPENQRDIRKLRKVAMSLHKIEKESLCEMIAEDIESRLKNLKIRHNKQERAAYLKSARPINEINRVFRAGEIIDAQLINTKDRYLGNIESISIHGQGGKIAYVVISHGGVLGLGEKYIGIPWDKLRWIQEEDIYVLDIPAQLLEKAPDIGETVWPVKIDFSWLEQ